MNYLCLILLCLFLILQVRAGPLESVEESSMYKPLRRLQKILNQQSADQITLPLDNVKITIKHHCNVVSRVNLKQTKRSLANEHLPVWILREYAYNNPSYENNFGLKRDYEVMKRVGKFTTYHDIETSSAAIYFHKRREFDGMIGYEYLIQKLSVDGINPTSENSVNLNQNGINSRPGYAAHKDDCKEVEEDPASGVNYQEGKKTYEGRVYDAYPEVLVIVSSNVFKNLIRKFDESDWYTSAISHVLTLFNGIDMLYSKLKETKIEINIAGVIIEEEESFLFLDDCYFTENTLLQRSGYKLDGECVNNFLQKYLYNRREKFSKDSYDLAIYLTTEKIYSVSQENETDEKALSIIGVANVIKDLYKSRINDKETILVGTITYTDYLDNYPVIAHEMAHLMTVMHDKTPFFTHDGKCLGRLLKTGGGWCDNCLSWSEISEKSFKLFFSSPNCCGMINEPRSLHPPGRLQMLTADTQCQCYGYQSAWKIRESLMNFCYSKLECMDENYRFAYTAIPLDGTPCRAIGVCWEGRCEHIKIFN